MRHGRDTPFPDNNGITRETRRAFHNSQKDLALVWKGNERGIPNSRKNLGKGRLGNNHAKTDYSITSLLKIELNRVPTIEEDGFDGKGHGECWNNSTETQLNTVNKMRDKNGRFVKGNDLRIKPGQVRNPNSRKNLDMDRKENKHAKKD
jgi:hypothetical protein